MKRYRIIKNGLCLEIYGNEDTFSSSKIAVYLYGFPGSAGKSEPVVRLVDAGFTVIQPHYRGSYDSSGSFGPSSSANLLTEVSEIISTGELSEVKKGATVTIDSHISLVMGHSFGAFAALKGAIGVNGIENIVLLGPVIAFNQSNEGVGLNEDGPKHYNYVEASRPHTYRLSKWKPEWSNLYTGLLDEYKGPAPASLKEVRVIVGELDSYFNTSLVKENSKIIVGNSLVGNYLIDVRCISQAGHGPAGLFDKDLIKFLERCA